MKKLKIAGLTLSPRLSIGDVRNAKAHEGVDLGKADSEGYAVRMMFDGLTFIEVIFALYKRQLAEHGITTQEQFDEKLSTDDDLTEAREVVVQAVSGFFPLVRTVYTKTKEALDGNLDDQIQEAAEKLKASPSGSNS